MAASEIFGPQAPRPRSPDLMVPPDITPQKLGLKTCVHGPDSAEVDIIAIHGIGVDPETTWVHGKTRTNWLKDKNMLQSKAPTARIMTFGFNSAWYGKSPVRKTIGGVSQELLSALVKERRNDPYRPIIFIGHCFGGIVIQKAYNAAKIHPEDYPGIYESVTGMVFLGTPHNGTRKSETQAQIYDAIHRANLRIQDEITKSITYNNETLVGIVYDFTRIIAQQQLPPQVFCFYEERETNVGKLLKTSIFEFIVDQTAGTLHGHRQQGLPLNHSDLNKYEDDQDGNYQVVSDEITRMVELARGRIKRSRQHNSAQQFPSTVSSSLLPFCSEPPFASRDGITDRIKALFQEKAIVALVHSSPGSGKTHIAVEYAQQLLRESSHIKVYWVHGGSSAEFERSYAAICNELRIEAPNGQKLNKVHQYLQSNMSGDWLMIMDGLDSEETLSPPETGADKNGASPVKSLLNYCPTGHLLGGRVLITTRSTAIASRMVKHDNTCILEVPRISKQDVIHLVLGEESRDLSTERLVLEVADKMHRSAAGLLLLSACIRELGIGQMKGRYLNSLKDQFQRPLEESYRGSAVIDNVMQPWMLLYQAVTETHHDAGRLLRVIAILELQSLPRYLFRKFTSSGEHLDRLFAILSNYAMIKTSRKEIYMPPIIRLCVLASMKQKNGDAFAAMSALSLVCESYPGSAGNEPEVCEVLQPAALAALKLNVDSSEARRLLAELSFKMASYAGHVGRRRTSVDHLTTCLDLRERDPERQASQVAETRRALEQAKTAFRKDEHEVSSNEDASTKLRADSHDPEWVRNASNQAALRHRRGSKSNLDNIHTFQQILEWCRKYCGDGHIDTGRNHFNLALSRDVQGQYESAEAGYYQAKEIVESSHCNNSSQMVLSVMSSLGRMYCTQRRFDEAKKVLQYVLTQQLEHLEPNHPNTLITRQNMALLLQESGNIDEAGDEIKRILHARVGLLGMDDPGTLGSACSLALNLRLRGHLVQAETIYRLVHGRQVSILGEDHADSVTTMVMLAELLQEMGRAQEARSAYKEVRRHRERFLGRQHDEVCYVERRLQELDRMTAQ